MGRTACTEPQFLYRVTFTFTLLVVLLQKHLTKCQKHYTIYKRCFCVHTRWRKKNACFLICLRFLSLGLPQTKVYVRKPRTVDDLKVSIHKEIANVPQEMLVNVMQNFEERLRTCVRQKGRHLSDIIFRN